MSEDARAQSGVGAKLAGTAYARLPLSPALRWTSRLSGLAYLYGRSEFNDIIAAAETGVEDQIGKSRYRLLGGQSYRFYAGPRYVGTTTLDLDDLRSVGQRSQLEIELTAGRNRYRSLTLQDGWTFDGQLSFEHAFSARTAARFTVSGERQTGRDPGYATVSGGAGAVLTREAGKLTLFAQASFNHLEADDRLFLYPQRRIEWLARAGVGATLRKITIHGFAPAIRFNYERNLSTVGIYGYARTGAEFAIVRAF